MEALILDIVNELARAGVVDDQLLDRIIQRHNKDIAHNAHHYAKRKLLPYYLKVKTGDPTRWERWGIDGATEKELLRLLQVKPRRTASGVATITVITKPQKCASDCLYCPNDLRMPKSYLPDEPACQRAERNFFDPYLQVTSRLRALTQMGHGTDKVELIILGGTWSDYPQAYQIWFITELFRALNDGEAAEQHSTERRTFYKTAGLSNRPDELAQRVFELQQAIYAGTRSYNQAFDQFYPPSAAWQAAAARQSATFGDLDAQQTVNESAAHRVVGLVVETRPDTMSAHNLTLLRRLGCTKVQIGIQSLNPALLDLNERAISLAQIQEAFELLRVFGFKIHAHFMLNLYGATVEADKQDYRQFVTDGAYLPDEVKLYPCSLVKGTRLGSHYRDGSWQPYTEEELLEVLVADTLATPPYVRISRMIRDISAHDIVAGNRKTNLRQLVEQRIEQTGAPINEIRHREISTDRLDGDALALNTLHYETTVSNEYFLQWVTPLARIVGFLRLSLPKHDYVRQHQTQLPVGPNEAMIREVHVYGKVADLHKTSDGGQHRGLGRRLIEAASTLAHQQGYTALNVISSVGTRQYYRRLGFRDRGLYQQKPLG